MGTEESVDKSFFLELEDPKIWLSNEVSIHFVLLFLILIGLFVSNIRYLDSIVLYSTSMHT